MYGAAHLRLARRQAAAAWGRPFNRPLSAFLISLRARACAAPALVRARVRRRLRTRTHAGGNRRGRPHGHGRDPAVRGGGRAGLGAGYQTARTCHRTWGL